jgi:lysozyme family protein
MRIFDELFDGVIKHEGYYANVEGDRGGETYMGIARNLHPNWKGWKIIDEYKAQHGKIKWNFKIDNLELTELVKQFYKETFYEHYRIDNIMNGSIQVIIFDWCVNSGKWGARGVQKVLNQSFTANLIIDGIIGSRTIMEINTSESETLFKAIHKARVRYYHAIAKKGQNQQFLDGWLKRVGAIKFEE